MRVGLAAVVIGLSALAAPLAATAQEATLRAVSAFAENTFYSRRYERFIEAVNASGKGLVRIQYIGGPKAMPPFEVGNALEAAASTSRTRRARSTPT